MNLHTNDIGNHNEHLFRGRGASLVSEVASNAPEKIDYTESRRTSTAPNFNSERASVSDRSESERVHIEGFENPPEQRDAITNIVDRTASDPRPMRPGVACIAASVSEAIVRLRDASRLNDEHEPARIYERVRATASKLRNTIGIGDDDSDEPFNYQDPLLNRIARRDHTLLIRRAKAKGVAYFRNFSPFMRGVALSLALVFLHNMLGPGVELAAQPSFDEYEAGSDDAIQSYIDRASRMQDKDAWNNYVTLGVASEFTDWEEDAYEELRQTYGEIENDANLTDDEKLGERLAAEALYEAARLEWEYEAEQQIREARGLFLADQADLDVAPITEEEYDAILAEAQSTVAAEADLNLDLWDATVSAIKAEFDARFEDELANRLDQAQAANADLTPEEQAQFDQALAQREAEIRREFEMRDMFYLQSGRNSYTSLMREDDMSARLLADQDSADSVGDEIIQETEEAVNAETGDLIEQANTSIDELTINAVNADEYLDSATGTWEEKMETVIDAGLFRWEQAEERLYSARLRWIEEKNASREEAERVWGVNHETLKAKREEWLRGVQEQITEGRKEWEAKFEEFAESRQQAETQLNEYILEERARRDATLQQLGDMVRGGGSALGEAKESYYYYTSLMSSIGAPPGGCPTALGGNAKLYCFYEEQAGVMAKGIQDFGRILGSAETELALNMESEENYTGLLRDVRAYAGDLPEEISELDEDDFRDDLEAMMADQAEDFVLYQRDIQSEIDRNELFVTRAEELAIETQPDIQNATTLEALKEIIRNYDEKYYDHQVEMFRVIAQKRDEELDDAALLAAVKTDLDEWFTGSQLEDRRLRERVLDYFNNGLAGYYLTGNENDPYLMTKAELEWELLRRERNYLAKRLARAEAVKRYADLAANHDAGIEMASITEEKAEVSRMRADIRELTYLVIKGDIELAPDAGDPATQQAEFDRVLGERGIDAGALSAKETLLAEEIGITSAIAGQGGVPTRVEIADWIDLIDDYLAANTGEDERPMHRLAALRSKLVALSEKIATGADRIPETWTGVNQTAAVLDAELVALRDSYDFDGFRADLGDLRSAIAGATVPELKEDLYAVREQLEANAIQLRDASIRVQEAKDAYRDARIDFDILNASNSAELIRQDIQNTTGKLAAVLNRMVTVETIPGFEDMILDNLSNARLEYLYQVSEAARANDDLVYAEDALREVQGLEAAKSRTEILHDILSSAEFGPSSGDARAQLFLDREAELIGQDAVDAQLQAHAPVQDSMRVLAEAKQAYLNAQAALTAAEGKAEPDQGEIDLRNAELSVVAREIDRAIEYLATAMRGEEKSRRELVVNVLKGTARDAETLREEARDDEQAFMDLQLELNESAGEQVEAFLKTNRGKTFSELIAAANARVNATARPIDKTIDGFESDLPTNTNYEIALIIREYTIQRKPLIDYANTPPAEMEYDRRTQQEKWDSIIRDVVDLRADAQFFQAFEDTIPKDDPDTATDESDTWVNQFRTERGAIADELSTVLASSDANLLTDYQALAPQTREIIESYGLVSIESTQDLRRTLNHAQRALELDLLSADVNYRAIYLREKAIELAAQEKAASAEYAELDRKIRILDSERALLRDDEADLTEAIGQETDPDKLLILEGQLESVEQRLLQLADRRALIQPDWEAKRKDLRNIRNGLREIERPGSTAVFASMARTHLVVHSISYQNKDFTADEMDRRTARDRETEGQRLQKKLIERDYGQTAEERLKAMIGFYETDANGAILRNADETPLLSDEFLLISPDFAPDTPLADVIGGDRTGPQLERWSERIIQWLEDPEKSRLLSPETLSAAQSLEGALLDLRIARRMIEEKDTDAATLQSLEEQKQEDLRLMSRKISYLNQFEDELAARINEAGQGSAVDGILAEIEDPENAFVFQLFKGFDRDGNPDGLENAEYQERIDELLRMARELNDLRRESTVNTIAEDYAATLATYLENYQTSPTFAGEMPQQEEFVSNYASLKAQGVRDALTALPTDDFRAKAWEWVGTSDESTRLYRAEIVEILHASAMEGEDLRSQILSAVDSVETDLDDSLTALMGEPVRRVIRDRDLAVEESVADLIATYATRGTQSQALLIPEIESVDDATTLADAKTVITQKLEEHVDHAAYASIRRELWAVIDAESDTASMKAAAIDYLATLADPASEDLALLDDELYEREALRAMALSDSTFAFEPEHYPTELHEFVLLRQHTRARERYAEYLRLRSSDLESVRGSAALDLTGIMGEVASSLLVKDFDEYVATNDPTTMLTELEGRAAVQDYVAAYMEDRLTAPQLLPGMGGDLYERAAHNEYLRMENAAGADGMHTLNEQDFFLDFRSYIMLSMVEDWVATNAVTITGATVAERREDFLTKFGGFLDHADYARNGKTIRERLLNSADIDGITNLAFAHLEEGTPLEKYLPLALEERRIDGTLSNPPKSFDEYLPEELTAIADYETRDYRAELRAVDDRYARVLAREEASAELSQRLVEGRLDLFETGTLALTNAEIDSIIARAGHGGVTAAERTELADIMREQVRAYDLEENGIVAQEGIDPNYEALIRRTLREERALRALYPTTADQRDLENFMAAEDYRVDVIEAVFFQELSASDDRLAELAKEERGAFLRAVIARSQGEPSAYYDALAADVQVAFDDFQARFFDPARDLKQEEIDALHAKPDEYARVFDLRSAQELVSSGLFERLDGILVAGITRSTDDELKERLKTDRSTLLPEFIDRILAFEDLKDAEDEAAAEAAETDTIGRIIVAMDPAFRDAIQKERVLVTRFADRFVESDADREELMAALRDPALIDPSLRLSPVYEIRRDMAEINQRVDHLTLSLGVTVGDHRRYFEDERDGMQEEMEMTTAMLEWAKDRGDELLSSRFANYRTFIGVESQFQDKEYENYVFINGNDQTFEQAMNGEVLAVETLSPDDPIDVLTLFDDPNWEERLRSDELDNVASIELGTTTVPTTDDRTIQVRTIRRVTGPAGRQQGDHVQQLNHTYHEHLANNYIEAISKLNAKLNAMTLAAELTDRRAEQSSQDALREQLEDSYDVDGAAGEADLDGFLLAKQNAQARVAQYSEATLKSKQQAVDGQEGAFDNAAKEFADAARRDQLRTMNMVAYIDTVYRAVADEMEAAQVEVDALAAEAEDLQQIFAGGNQAHVNRMNDMAKAFRDFQVANDRYEEDQAVKDWAQTPYLYASAPNQSDVTFGIDENGDLIDGDALVGDEEIDDALAQYAADAQSEYEIARRYLDRANARMGEAAYQVRTQDDIGVFYAIVEGLDEGLEYPPLTDAERETLLELRDRKFRDHEELSEDEENQLLSLTQREMYNRYETLIETRKEHIKHSLRMVRIHKANEIVNAEIRRLRGITDEKKKQFDAELDRRFGSMNNLADTEARNAVYQRLAGQVEAGAGDHMMEFRAWYWQAGGWVGQFGNAGLSALMQGGLLQITPGQILEGQMGIASAHGIPDEDKAAIGRWMAAGGSVSEFSNFQGTYFGYLTAIGMKDLAQIEKVITDAAMTVQIALGSTMVAAGVLTIINAGLAIALGSGMISTGFGLIAGIFTAPLGIALVAAGTIMALVGFTGMLGGLAAVFSGSQMIVQAQAKMAAATAKLVLMQQFEWLMLFNTQQSAGTDSTRKVMQKQSEYEQAKSELEYFTKIPDMQTMKERLIQYGAHRADNDSTEDLYKLTDEDLIYMFDSYNAGGDAQYITQTGATQELTDQEEDDAIDVTDQKQLTEYRDSFGRRYDGTKIVHGQPGPLRAGVYVGSDGTRYTRVMQSRHAGEKFWGYAPLIDEDAPETRSYNAGEVLGTLVDHGQRLRDKRRDAYYATGDAHAQDGDSTFILNERHETFAQLFRDAGGHVEGGREYTGYRMVYEEYEQNQQAVFEAELQQRVQMQTKEWDVREQELNDRYRQWEARMTAIVERGQRAWGGTEAKYLQEWRNWEREQDRAEAGAEELWQNRIREHKTAKKEWEDDLQQKAAEGATREILDDAIDSLNDQMRTASQTMGINLAPISKIARINEAIARIQSEQPTKLEQLKAINKDIKEFNTAVSLSEVIGANTGAGTVGIAQSFRAEMREHTEEMKLRAKVEMFEEYRRLLEGFKEQITVQNEMIANQTKGAALAAGYVEMGDIFVKQMQGVDFTGIVNAYKWYDVDAEVDRLMSDTGFANLEGDQLIAFLKDQNDVEIESYFYTQKLAAQTIFSRITGTARTEGERNLAIQTRGVETMGLFQNWVGKAPGEQDGYKLDALYNQAGGSYANDAMVRDLFIQDAAGMSFGELGSTGVRPGGAPLGFYLQLQWMGKLQSQEQASKGLTQSTIKGRGAMLKEQTAGVTVTTLAALGQSFGTAGGAAAAYITAATEINPATGKVSFKNSQRAMIEGARALAGAGGEYASAAANIAASGLEYNRKGQIVRAKYEGNDRTTMALMREVGKIGGKRLGGKVGGALSSAGGEAIGGMIGKFAGSIAAERSIELSYGHEHANYLGVIQSTILAAAAEMQGSAQQTDSESADPHAATPGEAMDLSIKQALADVVRGFGWVMDKAGNAIGGALKWLGAERLGNWFKDGMFETDARIDKYRNAEALRKLKAFQKYEGFRDGQIDEAALSEATAEGKEAYRTGDIQRYHDVKQLIEDIGGDISELESYARAIAHDFNTGGFDFRTILKQHGFHASDRLIELWAPRNSQRFLDIKAEQAAYRKHLLENVFGADQRLLDNFMRYHNRVMSGDTTLPELDRLLGVTLHLQDDNGDTNWAADLLGMVVGDDEATRIQDRYGGDNSWAWEMKADRIRQAMHDAGIHDENLVHEFIERGYQEARDVRNDTLAVDIANEESRSRWYAIGNVFETSWDVTFGDSNKSWSEQYSQNQSTFEANLRGYQQEYADRLYNNYSTDSFDGLARMSGYADQHRWRHGVRSVQNFVVEEAVTTVGTLGVGKIAAVGIKAGSYALRAGRVAGRVRLARQSLSAGYRAARAGNATRRAGTMARMGYAAGKTVNAAGRVGQKARSIARLARMRGAGGAMVREATIGALTDMSIYAATTPSSEQSGAGYFGALAKGAVLGGVAGGLTATFMKRATWKQGALTAVGMMTADAAWEVGLTEDALTTSEKGTAAIGGSIFGAGLTGAEYLGVTNTRAGKAGKLMYMAFLSAMVQVPAEILNNVALARLFDER